MRLFGTANLSQIVQAHGTMILYMIFSLETGILQFENDFQGISSALNTDGVNRYSHNKVSYSMWAIVMTVLNLPRKVCHAFANVWLVGTVPGNGTKEPNSLDPYLNILVDELLELTNKKVFDANQNAPFLS